MNYFKAITSRSLLQASALVFALILGGCAATQVDVGSEPAKRQLSDVLQEGDVTYAIKHDPWEGYNRWMYNFNAKFDRYIFIPTVNAYRKILPEFARTGIHNFFGNLGEFSNLANSMLQGKATQSGRTWVAWSLIVPSVLVA